MALTNLIDELTTNLRDNEDVRFCRDRHQPGVLLVYRTIYRKQGQIVSMKMAIDDDKLTFAKIDILAKTLNQLSTKTRKAAGI